MQRAGATLYGDLSRRLIRSIAEGRFAVGELLPTEFELAQRYQVSRHTVRAALKLLQDGGYISRKKAVGSRVESANPDSGYSQSVQAIDDLIEIAATEVRRLTSVSRVRLDVAQARRLEAPVGSRWLLFSGSRVDARRDGRPLSWANIYVDPAFHGIEASVRAEPQTLVSSIIERQYGERIGTIRQVVHATLLDKEVAAVLGAPEGGAALRVVRHYRNVSSRLVELTETLYPAGRVGIVSEFRREPRGRPEGV